MQGAGRVERALGTGAHRVVLPLLALLLVYRRWSGEPEVLVTLPAPTYTPLHPGASEPPPPPPHLSPDDYTRLVDLTDFRFSVQTLPCIAPTYPAAAGLLLVVLVASNPHNFDNRRVIRSTWGRETASMKLVFLVAEPADAVTGQKLANESATHGDLVWGSFMDAYRNMTYKHVMGLKWVRYHCPSARYVLKTDDDVVVNSGELRRFLSRELSPWGARHLIGCHVLEHARVLRSFRSKWRVSPDEFPERYYPPYCAGWAILYSADVVEQLYAEAQRAPYFWIDDVHVTGVLAKRAGLNHTHLNSLELTDSQMRMLSSFHYNPTGGAFLFGPPDLSVSFMKGLWYAIE